MAILYVCIWMDVVLNCKKTKGSHLRVHLRSHVKNIDTQFYYPTLWEILTHQVPGMEPDIYRFNKF